MAMAPAEEAFEDVPVPADALVVNVEGFEGPLDVLLALAKTQKVDLAKISILALVEQYLSFIAEIRRLRIELAADYLVMAAWLAYLKSRLLLPPAEEPEGPSGEELAARLAFQLRRLEAMRQAADRLMARPRLGRDVFPRGMPERFRVRRETRQTDTLFELLKAYSAIAARVTPRTYQPVRVPVLAIEEARARLQRLLGTLPDWVGLQPFLVDALKAPEDAELKRSRLASTFSAALELVKDGRLELRQLKTFGTIYVRRRSASADAPPDAYPSGAGANDA
ncbi:MAG: segregation/condensation protein A [Alphaproteobacteria bacterium]|nr:segregation/condensation protein A [Alphaproteobacteria bacterium]